ncbi:RsmD family RNA methyltransferase [Candidatus Saccharibacteria bacterium]|nr:RsmD family RNA methyltransferase [Candidatus Saccharibacteria bacterium]
MSAVKKSPRAKSSELRILSGKYKGTKLKSPDLATTHPMGSREKLALFNMLSPYLEGATVLDYFAGSGALGLEALSRGAASVTFIENNPKALQTIRENCERCGAMGDKWQAARCFPNNKEIFPRKITNARGPESETVAKRNFSEGPPERCDFEGRKISRSENISRLPSFSIIISDPPYDNYQVPDYEKLLKKGGILALSHPKDFNLKAITGLTLLKTNHYAACHISLFTK